MQFVILFDPDPIIIGFADETSNLQLFAVVKYDEL